MAHAVNAIVASRAHAPLTSSAGRLFDAVAAILGVRDRISYEGQAAIELEQLAETSRDTGGYPVTMTDAGATFEVAGADVVRAVADDVMAGTPHADVASRFHETMARVVRDGCRRARDRSGLTTVALTGGVFQNVRLLSRALELLEADGFRALRHQEVPSNDGGLSLGQAVIAAQQAC
jgi:hydrogenase maturation protein HypF